MTRVSAAVINWNNREYILGCLRSLLAQTNVELDVVILDNGSTDGSVELIESEYPRLRVIKNGKNLGFAAAHNIGFRETSGEWHLVLNSDVVLQPNYIGSLISAASHDRQIGAAGGKLLRFELSLGEPVIDSVGIEMFASRRVWDRGTGEIDRGQYEVEQRVFGCCAAAALYRREAMMSIAPDGEIFPEIYFAYYEDVDLAWRMNERGWSCLYVPTAVGRHVRGGSTTGSATTRRLVFRNRYVLMVRNDSLSGLLRNAGPVIAVESAQLLRLIKYPNLLLQIPRIVAAATRALKQRHQMKQAGRRFGMQDFEHLVSRGSGVLHWIRKSQSSDSKRSMATKQPGDQT